MPHSIVYRSETPRHVYWVSTDDHGLFYPEAQPINQKTGKPWQASRRIKDGADKSYVLGVAGDYLVIDAPELPKDWPTYGGRTNITAWDFHFSTLELAIEAIRRHAARNDK